MTLDDADLGPDSGPEELAEDAAWEIPYWFDDDQFDKALTAQRTLAILKGAFDVEKDSYDLFLKQQKARKVWGAVYITLGLGTVLVAAMSGVSALMEVTGVAAVLGFLAAFLGGAVGFLRPDEKAAESERMARAAVAVSDRARLFRESRLPNLLADSAGDKLVSDLMHRADSVLSSLTEDLSSVRNGDEPKYKTQLLEETSQTGPPSPTA